MVLAFSFIIAIFGVWLLVVSSRLTGGESLAVASALLVDDNDIAKDPKPIKNVLIADKTAANQSRKGSWFVGAAVASILSVLFLKLSVSSFIVAILIGVAAGELYDSRNKDRMKRLRLKKMEFYLPMAMERIVMAVSSGLDIIPALREAAHKGSDPVSDLMRWIVELAESGTPVDAAFELAATQDLTPALKHACVHLALAHRQGGEIVRPLKELSDATQSAYQESVEEQIAKLPVKAVLPLVLTFTGLIVCFLTVPLIQVGSITKEVASVASK